MHTHRKMIMSRIWRNIAGVWMLLALVSDKGDERREHIHEVEMHSLEITVKCPSGSSIPLSVESNAVGKVLFDKVESLTGIPANNN